MSIVSESGLYKLIMRSDKAEAAEFQNWVTREMGIKTFSTPGGQQRYGINSVAFSITQRRHALQATDPAPTVPTRPHGPQKPPLRPRISQDH
ncbi:MAG: hypothetical protein H2055_08090 [Sphingopyxis sp.]|nr:hypothetical protein [Sphingopyxis sp.]